MRYTTAGQGHPEPSPYDTRMFDTKVRFVGDRVAAVAAESLAAARAAAALIAVDYEQLDPVLSIDAALAPGAPVIHDEDDSLDIWDPAHNIASVVAARAGDVARGLAESAAVVEVTVETQYAQHAPLEPHVVVTHLDPNGRIVILSSTQVPFHVRRIVARLLDLPIHRIRVIKPRLGGGFGVKQEVLIEDVAAIVTLRTGRPVRFEYTREQEFVSSRTRHPMRIRMRLGAGKDGTLHAVEMDAISNTGAYGAHALTVMSNTGSKTLPLYNRAPHVAFSGRVVYTNLPVAGAYRGYGEPRGRSPSRPQWTNWRIGSASMQWCSASATTSAPARPRRSLRSSAKVARGRRRSSPRAPSANVYAGVPNVSVGRNGGPATPGMARCGAGWGCLRTCRARGSPSSTWPPPP